MGSQQKRKQIAQACEACRTHKRKVSTPRELKMLIRLPACSVMARDRRVDHASRVESPADTSDQRSDKRNGSMKTFKSNDPHIKGCLTS